MVILIGVLSFIVNTSSSNSGVVNMVKSGTLGIDNTVTIGDALDNYQYFDSTDLRAFETQQKRTIVEFKGEIKKGGMEINGLDKKYFDKNVDRVRVVIQFALGKDNSSFKIQHIGYEVVEKEGKVKEISKKMDVIQEIYSNKKLSTGFALIYNF